MIQFIVTQFAHTFKNICKFFLFMSKDYYFIIIFLKQPNTLGLYITKYIRHSFSLGTLLWLPFYDFRGNFLSVSYA